MTSLVATIVFLLLVTAWWSVAALPAPPRPAVFGRGELRGHGGWHPVGAGEEALPPAPGATPCRPPDALL